MATDTRSTRDAADKLPDLAHRSGCPAARRERYTAGRPDGTTVTVDRCVDCGVELVDGVPTH